ncbi:MAG: HIT family protein [Mycoplasma sp.]
MSNNYNPNCPFCKIIKKEWKSYIVYETSNVLAILDIHPITIGHTLIMPKHHHQDFLQTPLEILKEVDEVAKEVMQLMKKKLNVNNFNVATNIGKLACQEVMHYHLHIIPRYEQKKETNPKNTRLKITDHDLEYLCKQFQVL